MIKLTSDQKNEIIRLALDSQQKWTVGQLAREFGVVYSTVWTLVQRAMEDRAPARPGWQPHLAIEEPAGYNYLNPWLEGEP